MIYRRFIAPLPIETALLIYEWRNSPFRDRPSFHSETLRILEFRVKFLWRIRNLETRRQYFVLRDELLSQGYEYIFESITLLSRLTPFVLIFFSFLVTLLLRSVSIREKSFSTPKCNSLQTLEFLLFVYVSRAISTRSKYPKNNSIIITACDKLLLRSVLLVQNEKTKSI